MKGNDEAIYEHIAPFAMNWNILREFDGYPIVTDESHTWFLVFLKDKLIAWASLRKEKKVVRFVTAYVLPDYRRKGIHTELIYQRMDWCEKNGFLNIEVDCMENTIKSFKKIGFKIVKSFKKWHRLALEIVYPEMV
jgi:GNAT superfamily N-acetyltransferase